MFTVNLIVFFDIALFAEVLRVTTTFLLADFLNDLFGVVNFVVTLVTFKVTVLDDALLYASFANLTVHL